MALIKSKTLSSGVVAEYYRISKIVVNRPTRVVEAYLSLYIDQATAVGGAAPVVTNMKKYTFTLTQPELDGNLAQALYPKILDAAEATMSVDILGNVLSPAAAFDPDLDGATST